MSLRHLLGTGAACLAVAATMLPHTVFLEKIRQIRAKYNWKQEEEPLTEKLKKRFEEVMDDILLEKEDRDLFRFFHVFGCNVFHAGSLWTKYGAVVGVPIYFRYDDVGSINKDDISLPDVFIDWNTAAAKNFLKTLILSENAQKFAIAREILKVQKDNIFYRTFHTLVDVIIVLAVYSSLRKTFHLHKRGKLYHSMIVSLLSIGGFSLWAMTSDSVNFETDLSVDHELATLGSNYIKGGHEFYDKLLNRNKALRILLGEDGQKLFTAHGNECYILRRRNAPVYDRKSFFDSKLQELQQV